MIFIIRFNSKGDFSKANTFLQRTLEIVKLSDLDKYGRRGVEALRASTPKDTGKTADSWDYKIVRDREGIRLYWTNSNINNGVNIAVILQYGHGTGTGGYVAGVDYINPTLKPIFEDILNSMWREVTSL